jgi:hypothetical protein
MAVITVSGAMQQLRAHCDGLLRPRKRRPIAALSGSPTIAGVGKDDFRLPASLKGIHLRAKPFRRRAQRVVREVGITGSTPIICTEGEAIGLCGANSSTTI